MTGFDVQYINFIKNPVPVDEVTKIIEISKQENQRKIQEEKKSVEKKEEVERKIFEDPRLAGDKKVIEWIFGKIEKVVELTK